MWVKPYLLEAQTVFLQSLCYIETHKTTCAAMYHTNCGFSDSSKIRSACV